MNQPAKPHFETIDLLRGFAAISVLVYHVIEFNGWRDFPESGGLIWFKWGWMGVDIFYVISGFVITLSVLSLRDKYGDNPKKVFLKFMGRRLARIAPLHYLTLFICLFLFSEITAKPDFGGDLLSHLFFVHNLFPTYHRSINAANWTLGVEMQFYIALVLIIPFVTPKNLVRFVACAFLCAFVWRLFSFLIADHASPTFPDGLFMAATQLPGMVDFFACGMLLAFFARSNYFNRLQGGILYKFGLFCALVLGAAFIFHIYIINYDTYWHLPGMVIFFRSGLAVLFSLLVLFVCSFRLSARVRKLVAPLLYLGVISYGIYLFHLPVVLLLKDTGLPNPIKLALTLAVAIGLACLSWKYFESFFLRLARGKSKD